jgi:hypothetical protein
MTECKAPAPTLDVASEPHSSPGACLVLGAAGALLVSALPDAVLLPADRLPPRHVGLLVTGLLLAPAGGRPSAMPPGGPRTCPGRAPAGGRRGGAGCLARRWCRRCARRWPRPCGATHLPYYLLVAAAVALVAAPAALPLGGLLAPSLGGPRRLSTTALLLGAAVGLATRPWLLEVLLGPQPCLRWRACCAAPARCCHGDRAAAGDPPHFAGQRRPRAPLAGPRAAVGVRCWTSS